MKSLLALAAAFLPLLLQAQVSPELLAMGVPNSESEPIVEPVELSLNEREAAFPHSISARMLMVDFGVDAFGEPGMSNAIEAAYTRRVSSLLSVSAPLKAGVINSAEDAGIKHPFVGLDAMAKIGHSFFDDRVRPYVTGGLGVVAESDNGANAQLPLGAGLRIRVSDAAYLTGQYEYRKSFSAGRDNKQIGLGVVFNLGRSEFDPQYWDTDNDGVMDHEDACIDVAGSKRMRGCPDSDNDGIYDAIDLCPLYAGPKKDGGCPDADGDGVPDPNDACPDVVGVAGRGGCPIPDADGDGTADEDDACPDLPGTMNGCPDSDADGIADLNDPCPNNPGPKATGGCPDRDDDGIADDKDDCPLLPGTLGGCPDRDQDGVDDTRDKCPNIAGTFQGCPEIMSAQQQLFDRAVRSIAFETADTDLSTYAVEHLRGIAEILKEYPNYRLAITGHADFQEQVPNRDELSLERARTCAAFLQTLDIEPARLVLDGIGAGRPLEREGSEEQRAINRRVEFDFYEK